MNISNHQNIRKKGTFNFAKIHNPILPTAQPRKQVTTNLATSNLNQTQSDCKNRQLQEAQRSGLPNVPSPSILRNNSVQEEPDTPESVNATDLGSFLNTFCHPSCKIPNDVKKAYHKALQDLFEKWKMYPGRLEEVISIVTKGYNGWVGMVSEKLRFLSDLLHRCGKVGHDDTILLLWVISEVLSHSDFHKTWLSQPSQDQILVLAHLFLVLENLVNQCWNNFREKLDELIAIRQNIGAYLPQQAFLQLDDNLNFKTNFEWKESISKLRTKGIADFYPDKAVSINGPPGPAPNSLDCMIVSTSSATVIDAQDLKNAMKTTEAEAIQVIIDPPAQDEILSKRSAEAGFFDEPSTSKRARTGDPNENLHVVWADHHLSPSDFVDNLLSGTIQEWGVVEKQGKLRFKFVHNTNLRSFKYKKC